LVFAESGILLADHRQLPARGVGANRVLKEIRILAPDDFGVAPQHRLLGCEIGRIVGDRDGIDRLRSRLPCHNVGNEVFQCLRGCGLVAVLDRLHRLGKAGTIDNRVRRGRRGSFATGLLALLRLVLVERLIGDNAHAREVDKLLLGDVELLAIDIDGEGLWASGCWSRGGCRRRLGGRPYPTGHSLLDRLRGGFYRIRVLIVTICFNLAECRIGWPRLAMLLTRIGCFGMVVRLAKLRLKLPLAVLGDLLHRDFARSRFARLGLLNMRLREESRGGNFKVCAIAHDLTLPYHK
jgi:hypothetical protein